MVSWQTKYVDIRYVRKKTSQPDYEVFLHNQVTPKILNFLFDL